MSMLKRIELKVRGNDETAMEVETGPHLAGARVKGREGNECLALNMEPNQHPYIAYYGRKGATPRLALSMEPDGVRVQLALPYGGMRYISLDELIALASKAEPALV